MNTHANPRHLPSSGIVIDRRTLFQCVVLSMLLHLWIVLLFGTTTYNGARGERGFGDVFDVTLRALTEEGGPGFRLAPGADTASPGTALLPRAGNRTPAPRARDLTRPAETVAPLPTPGVGVPESTTPATEISPPPANAAPTIAPPAVEPLPRLNLDAPEVVDKPYVPATPPPPIEREVTPPSRSARAMSFHLRHRSSESRRRRSSASRRRFRRPSPATRCPHRPSR